MSHGPQKNLKKKFLQKKDKDYTDGTAVLVQKESSVSFLLHLPFLSVDSSLLGSPQVKHRHRVSLRQWISPHVLLMNDIFTKQFAEL